MDEDNSHKAEIYSYVEAIDSNKNQTNFSLKNKKNNPINNSFVT